MILPLQDGWGVGMRAAFEINQNSVGFTPLVNKKFPFFPGSNSVGLWKATCRCGSFGYQMGPTLPLWALSCIQVWRSEREGGAIARHAAAGKCITKQFIS